MQTVEMQSVRRLCADRNSGMAAERLVRDALDRIESGEPALRAFAHFAPETTLRAIRKNLHPLSGIAIGVKDIFDTYDMPTGYGSPLYSGHRPVCDAALVSMCKRAGAAIAGKTVTTEFAFFHPGPTVNPHNNAHTPGGSSSGSAAAIAAGMIPAGLATQTGGSVVRPASFCGIAGFKPSFRLLPTVGMKYFSQSLDTAGLMAATVDDVACLAARLTGRPLDIQPVEPGHICIGLYKTSVWAEASEEMQNAVLETFERARTAGFKVIEIDEPSELATAREIHPIIQDFEAAQNCAFEFDHHRSMLSAKLTETLENATEIQPAAYDVARRNAKRARESIRPVFDTVDVLLTPSAPGAAPHGLETTGVPTFNKLWTLLGVPTISIPGLKDQANMPLGIQLVGRFGTDQKVLSVAAALEKLISPPES